MQNCNDISTIGTIGTIYIICLIIAGTAIDAFADYNEGWNEGKEMAERIGQDTSDPDKMMNNLGKPFFDKEEKMKPMSGQDPVFECSTTGKTFKDIGICTTNCVGGSCVQGFTAQIQSPSSHNFLVVTASIAADGNMSFTAQQDLDMNGVFDNTYSPSNPISAICSTGYLSCPSGTYTASLCSAHKWSSSNGVIQETLLSPTQGQSPLGYCRCITTHCGYSMAGEGAKNALEDVGSAMVVAINNQGDAKYSISKVETDIVNMRVTYNGQKSSIAGGAAFDYTGGHPNPEIFLGNASGLTAAAQAEQTNQLSDPNSLGYFVYNSPATQSKTSSLFTCQIKKNVSVSTREETHYCYTTYDFDWYAVSEWSHINYCTCNNECGVDNRCPCAASGTEDQSGVVNPSEPHCPSNTPPPGAFQVGYHRLLETGDHIFRCFRKNYWAYTIQIDDPPLVSTTSTCSPDSSCTLKNEQVCDYNGGNCIYTIKNGVSSNSTVPATCTQTSSLQYTYDVCAMGTHFSVKNQTDLSVQSISDGQPNWFTIKREYHCTSDSSGIDLTDAKRQSKAIKDSTTISNDGTLSYSATSRAYDPVTKTFGAVTSDSNTKSIGADTIKTTEQGQVCRVQSPSQKTDVNEGQADVDMLVTTAMPQIAVRLCSKNDAGIWVCPYDPGKGESISKDCSVDSMFKEAISTLGAMEEIRKGAICAQE